MYKPLGALNLNDQSLSSARIYSSGLARRGLGLKLLGKGRMTVA